MGERPAILSRGYGRRRVTPGPLVVSDGRRVVASVEESGDEPMLLARLVPEAIVIVGASRYASGRLAEQTLGATFHVLDDGFQHVRLARDLDVLMTTPGEIMEGRVLPLGRLREGAAAAAHADVLVVTGATASDAAAEAQSLGIAQSCGAMRVLGAAEWVTRRTRRSISRVCSPSTGLWWWWLAWRTRQRFFEGLEAEGWVVTRIPLADHHWFTASDVARIAAAVHESGARMVMATEKDVVKLERLMPLPFPLVSVPMRLHIEPPSALDSGSPTRDTVARRSRTGVAVRHARSTAAVALARGLVRLLPDGGGARAWVGGRRGRATPIDRPHRRVALANLEQCFPGKTTAEHQRTGARACSRTSAGCCSRS